MGKACQVGLGHYTSKISSRRFAARPFDDFGAGDGVPERFEHEARLSSGRNRVGEHANSPRPADSDRGRQAAPGLYW